MGVINNFSNSHFENQKNFTDYINIYLSGLIDKLKDEPSISSKEKQCLEKAILIFETKEKFETSDSTRNKLDQLKILIDKKSRSLNFTKLAFAKTFDLIELIPIEEKDKITCQANLLLNAFNELISGLNQDHQIDFQLVETLKSLKKQAEQFRHHPKCPEMAKKALKEVIITYQTLVESVDVLKILQEISRQIRQQDKFHVFASSFNRFKSFLIYMMSLRGQLEDVETLAKEYRYKQENWQKKWKTIRQAMWTASLEADVFFKEGKKITFLTGSKSSSLPLILMIPKLATLLSSRPALIPTGQLLDHNIVPLSGELTWGIQHESGINRHHLSGMELSGLDVCLGYARKEGFAFNPSEDLELIFKQTIDNYSLIQLKLRLLRLLLTGQKANQYEAIKIHLAKLKQAFSVFKLSLNENWKEQANIVGQVCDEPRLLLNANQTVKRGQIVVIQVKIGCCSSQWLHGMVLKQESKDKYRILTDLTMGTSFVCSSDEIYLVPESNLKKYFGVLSLEKQHLIEKKMQSLDEQVAHIEHLFDSVKPISFTNEDWKLIHSPFPIVWASVTMKNTEKHVSSMIKNEKCFEGIAILGHDVQFVFTDRDHVKQLESIVSKYDVRVLSFEAAYYILGKSLDI